MPLTINPSPRNTASDMMPRIVLLAVGCVMMGRGLELHIVAQPRYAGDRSFPLEAGIGTFFAILGAVVVLVGIVLIILQIRKGH